MKIGVIGFGHFAGIVSVCLASKLHVVFPYDETPPLVRSDQKLASDEPGYRALWDAHWQRICRQPVQVANLNDCDLLWIAYDVPLDAAGAPVVDEILARITRLDAAVQKSIPFLVSCQWPVGTTRKIASECEGREFVYVMENVRVGKAIADFQKDPIPAIGACANFIVSAPSAREFIANNLPWDGRERVIGSWESIEFAKHSMNAFLALQIAFVNELARIAPPDVNMADVTRVLKSDPRVSPLAPLSAGGPFGGGSLKRDLTVLQTLTRGSYSCPIIDSILESNNWTLHRGKPA